MQQGLLHSAPSGVVDHTLAVARGSGDAHSARWRAVPLPCILLWLGDPNNERRRSFDVWSLPTASGSTPDCIVPAVWDVAGERPWEYSAPGMGACASVTTRGEGLSY